MAEAITGGVENSRLAQLDARGLYQDEVGVRERGGTLELAWFGRPPAFTAAVTGKLDDQAIRVTGVRSRDLSQAQPLRQRAATGKAITATAEPLQILPDG